LQSVAIRYEQAVYGSFPFWDKGYAVLAHSPGCRTDWLAGLRAACQRFGERPAGVSEAQVRGLFALRLHDGPWMIVGVSSPGSDDRGRPGALAFHALFLSPREYRRLRCNPFPLAEALRTDWTAADASRPLPAGTWAIPQSRPPEASPDPSPARIAAALAQGHRVALEAAAPIDALAPQVWRLLPVRVRRRATVATWAFGNGNRFDLVALPRRRLAEIARDPSYLDLAALERADDPAATARLGVTRRLPWVIAGAVLLLAGLILIAGLAWR